MDSTVTGFTLGSTLGFMTSIAIHPYSRNGNLFIDFIKAPLTSLTFGISSGLIIDMAPSNMKTPINYSLTFFTLLNVYVLYRKIC
jgi:hypothetical protein